MACPELLAGGVVLRGWDDGGEGVFELLIDIDVFEDHELGAGLALVESAGASGNNDDRRIGGLGTSLDGGDEFAAVHKGHLHIGDDEARGDAIEDLKSIAPVGSRFDGKSAFFEEAADGMPDQHRIIDDQGDRRHEDPCTHTCK